jgi:hypothetical protein
MQDRPKIKVDEKEIQQMMVAEVPLYRVQEIPKQPEIAPEAELSHREEGAEFDVENIKAQKKKRNSKPNFVEIFLKDNKIRDRRQIYISKEAYDKVSGYLRYIGKGDVSLVSYVDNILFHHMDEYRETINELYNSNISTPL